MSVILGVAFSIVVALLGWDRVVKKRRVARREPMDDSLFLREFRGNENTPLDSRILEVRSLISKEFGLPAARVRPDDLLSELRDQFSLVVSGHMALGDLFFDLDDERRKKRLPRRTDIMTVSDYISAFIEPSSESHSE